MDTISQIHNIYFYVSQHNYMFQLPILAIFRMHWNLKKGIIYIKDGGEIWDLQKKIHT